MVLATLYNQEYSRWAETSAVAEYALKWGYSHACLRFRDPSVTSWWKVPYVLMLSQLYSTVLWMDADVVVVNFDVEIAPLVQEGITLSVDTYGICAGVFGVRGVLGREILETALLVGDLTDSTNQRFGGAVKYEQNVLKLLAESSRRLAGAVHTFPMGLVSCPGVPATNQTWAHHYWASG